MKYNPVIFDTKLGVNHKRISGKMEINATFWTFFIVVFVVLDIIRAYV